MDAIDFLNKEYENTENFNTRALLRKLNALEQYILIELMNKFAVQLANVNPTSQEQLAAPAVSESVCMCKTKNISGVINGVAYCEDSGLPKQTVC